MQAAPSDHSGDDRWKVPVRAALCTVVCLLCMPGCDDAAKPNAAAPISQRTSPTAIPELKAPFMATPGIKIDGKLDESAWGKAAGSGAFVNPTTGRPAPRSAVQGECKIFYNNKYLYVGFEVKDQTIKGGFPAASVDPHLWERDTVELMIDPDGDGDNRDYYEIQINPQNLVFDSRFDNYNQPRGGPAGPFGHQDWTSGVRSAVQLRGSLDDDSDRDEGYTVELAIPWSSFGKARHSPPRPGDRWRLNFYAMQNNGGVSWSPILGKGNFHRASRFGRVQWLAP